MAKLQVAFKKSDYMYGSGHYVPLSDADMTETFRPHDGDNDYNRLYDETPRYELRTVEAPEGLQDYEYCHLQDRYIHLMMNYPECPANWARKLVKMEREQRNVCINLLKVKAFRSDFRRSLRQQLEAWLNGDNDYKSPFSAKQWETQWAANAYRPRRRYA